MVHSALKEIENAVPCIKFVDDSFDQSNLPTDYIEVTRIHGLVLVIQIVSFKCITI